MSRTYKTRGRGPPTIVPVRFDTKIAILVRDDLETWQKLNVTAFLASGIAAANPELSASRTPTRTARRTCRCSGSPCWCSRRQGKLTAAHQRALARGCRWRSSPPTCSDRARRGQPGRGRAVPRGELDLVGMAVHGPRNAVDKIMKGSALHC